MATPRPSIHRGTGISNRMPANPKAMRLDPLITGLIKSVPWRVTAMAQNLSNSAAVAEER